MRESDFVKQNQEKWSELEKILELKDKDPDKLSSLFTQITDDLSFSRTFYKNRSVKVYLNNIAQQVFHSIYKNKKEKRKQFVLFWKEELPRIIHESRKELRLSLTIFVLAMVIGVVSYANDPAFARVILGEQYIEMTNENIRSGDPMAVYKKMNQVDMFLGITFNNIMVAFRTFILGIFFAIGTIAVMVYNGIMVGVFQYFFYQKGLFMESFLTIWLHGTLEISCIIIAGGAGLTLGKGLVFPGTYSRLQAFQLSARRGLKLLVAIIPILIFAALIESFLTRYTDVPDVLRLSIIIMSLLFILGYFVWYPYRKAKEGFPGSVTDDKLTVPANAKIDFTDVKGNGEIFRDTFVFYKKKLKPVLKIILISSVLYTILTFLLYPEILLTPFYSSDYFFVLHLFDYKNYPLSGLLNMLTFSIPSYYICSYLTLESEGKALNTRLSLNHFFRNYHKALIVSAILNGLLFISAPFGALLFIPLFPFMLLWQYIMFKEKGTIFYCFGRTFKVIGNMLGTVIVIYLMIAFIGVIYFFFIDSPLVYSYFEILNWNLSLETETTQQLFIILMMFTSVFALQLVLPLLVIAKGILYFSLKEIAEATSLKERIKNFGIIK